MEAQVGTLRDGRKRRPHIHSLSHYQGHYGLSFIDRS
jgi:hypothetical protein